MKFVRHILRPSHWLHLGFLLAAAGLAITHVGWRFGWTPSPVDIDLSAGEMMEMEDAVLVLKRFSIPSYASGKPRQYVSELHCMSGEGKARKVENVTVSVNHPFRRKGWWVYQSSWGEDAHGRYTVLRCVRDPGLPVAATGGVLLLVGALMFAVKDWRRTAREENAVRVVETAPTRGAGAWLRRNWPYLAAMAVSAFPVFFIGRSVLRPDRMPALQSPLLFPHILAYLFSYIVMLFAAFGLLRRMVGAAFFLMTLGLVLGALWGKICWSEWWQFDPKEMWSLATWLTYGVYFHVKFFRGASPAGRRRVERALLVAGAVMVVLTLTWVNFSRLFNGLHSYA